jgi:hypothetical protein
MANIFASQPGKVVALATDSALPAIIRVQGFAPKKAIISQIGYSSKVLAQFMMTLRNHIFVYTIGDDMGDLNITGLTFATMCNQSSRSHGVTEIFGIYDQKKLSKSNLPITVTIGDYSISALLVGIQVSAQSEKAGVVDYALMLKTIPQELNTRYLDWYEEDVEEEEESDEIMTEEAPSEATLEVLSLSRESSLPVSAAISSLLSPENIIADAKNVWNTYQSTGDKIVGYLSKFWE